MWEKAKTINDKWNDLPRRCLLVLILLGAMFLLGKTFRYYAPFAFAALFAWMCMPAVRFLEKKLKKVRFGEKIAAGSVVLLFYGIFFGLAYLLGATLYDQAAALGEDLPVYAQEISLWLEQVENNGVEILGHHLNLPLTSWIGNLTQTLISYVSNRAPELAVKMLDYAMSVPQIILFVVMLVMGTFYFITCRAAICKFAKDWLPEKFLDRMQIIRKTAVAAVLGQVRAALIMMVITAVELVIGFTILRMDYALLLGIIIGVVDVLPVVGAGAFLIPMSVYALLTGHILRGLGMLLLYGIIVVLRQIVQPKVVSQQLGLNPLLTMMSMYAGFLLMGVTGMLIGPVTFLIVRGALVTENTLGAKSDMPVQEENKQAAKADTKL